MLRKFIFYKYWIDSLRAADSADTLFVIHDTSGAIAYSGYSGSSAEAYEINLLNDFGLNILAEYMASEWNHSENRLPYTGYMFDVWNAHGTYAIWSGGAPGSG